MHGTRFVSDISQKKQPLFSWKNTLTGWSLKWKFLVFIVRYSRTAAVKFMNEQSMRSL
jgi:hypothetical protein